MNLEDAKKKLRDYGIPNGMRVYDVPIEEFDRDDLLHIAAMLYGCVEVRGYPHGCS